MLKLDNNFIEKPKKHIDSTTQIGRGH